jgi:hypothetical protein
MSQAIPAACGLIVLEEVCGMRVLIMMLSVMAIVGCATSPMLGGKDAMPDFCKNFVAEAPDNLDDSFPGSREVWENFNKFYQDAKQRKLVVFMDGTGNDKSSATNVRKLYRLSVQQACSGKAVISYYDRGVGAKWNNRVLGGLLGEGASLNIRQAYRFLVEAYNPGDEIYLIGFSRGAFTARSLNGFIKFAGLVDRSTIESKWYDAVPLLGMSSLHSTVGSLYGAYKVAYNGNPTFDSYLEGELVKEKTKQGVRSIEIMVSAIGVFDTVPAYGLFHDDEPDNHRLDLYARQGFHALSLDEQRNDFRVLRFEPLRLSGDQELREVWFAGVHSDIGGSYSKSFDCVLAETKDPHRGHPDHYRPGLESTSLNWMLRSFEEFEIFPKGTRSKECPDGSLHDEFFGKTGWLYHDLGTFRRTPRQGDFIHESVLTRLLKPQLEDPHSEREPGGKYHFMGLPGPAAMEKYFLPYDSDKKEYSKKHFVVVPSDSQ